MEQLSPLLPGNDTDRTVVEDDGDWHQFHRRFFISHIIAALVMTVWPWIFFAVVFCKGGIELHGRAALTVYNHSKDTIFIVTTFASIMTFFIDYLFTKAVTSLAQKWVIHKDLDIFRISFFTALKSHEFLWHSEDWRELLRPSRALLAPTVVLFIVTFTFVTSGLTSLLTPTTYTRKSSLTGTELDFASTDPGCISWFNGNIIPNSCNWATYNGTTYTTCLGEDRMIDALNWGRGHMVSLVANDSSLALPQLGVPNKVRFLVPLQGVLPIGPNGVPAFNTVAPSPFSERSVPGNLPYNYTLDLQGLVTNVTCNYDTTTPIFFTQVSLGIYQYNATCPTGQDALPDATFIIISSNNTLGFWACDTSPQGSSGESYNLYFIGTGSYSETFGNITCSLSPVNLAVFRTTYTSHTAFFSIDSTTSNPETTSTELISRSVMALGDIISTAQDVESNLVVESVIAFGVKLFQLPRYVQDSRYLALLEAMIEGILQYDATYICLLYTMQTQTPTPPQSCIRTIHGSADYPVFGWSLTGKSAAYLLPVTLINLSSFVILVYAMLISDHGPKMLPRFDPLKPQALVRDSDQRLSAIDPTESRVWKTKMVYAKDENGSYAFQVKPPPDAGGNDNNS